MITRSLQMYQRKYNENQKIQKTIDYENIIYQNLCNAAKVLIPRGKFVALHAHIKKNAEPQRFQHLSKEVRKKRKKKHKVEKVIKNKI